MSSLDLTTCSDADLIAHARELSVDDESHEYWEAVGVLQGRCTAAVFARMSELVAAADPIDRRFACDVLSQLGPTNERPFGEQSLPLLIAATQDIDPRVVASAVTAIGHHRNPAALNTLLPLVSADHEPTRFALALALPHLISKDADERHPGVVALMHLTTDRSADVRDWATFGVGTQLDVDGPAIRACLTARLLDDDEDTRREALDGLARRPA